MNEILEHKTNVDDLHLACPVPHGVMFISIYIQVLNKHTDQYQKANNLYWTRAVWLIPNIIQKSERLGSYYMIIQRFAWLLVITQKS